MGAANLLMMVLVLVMELWLMLLMLLVVSLLLVLTVKQVLLVLLVLLLHEQDGLLSFERVLGAVVPVAPDDDDVADRHVRDFHGVVVVHG